MNKTGKKKIVAICGSPTKGMTYKALKDIENNYPDIDYKIIHIKDANIEQCVGCYQCVRKGEDRCPLKDDKDMILEEIDKADGVIFASPVYVNHISGLMKNFMDRIGFITHRPRYFDKFAMVIGVCRGFGADKVTEYLGSILTTFGFSVVSSLELQYSSRSDKEIQYNHEKIIEGMDTLLEKIEKGKRNKPELIQVIMFNLFKYISEAHPEDYPADYEYYKDKSGYYYDTKINFFHNFIAGRVQKKFDNDMIKNRI